MLESKCTTPEPSWLFEEHFHIATLAGNTHTQQRGIFLRNGRYESHRTKRTPVCTAAVLSYEGAIAGKVYPVCNTTLTYNLRRFDNYFKALPAIFLLPTQRSIHPMGKSWPWRASPHHGVAEAIIGQFTYLHRCSRITENQINNPHARNDMKHFGKGDSVLSGNRRCITLISFCHNLQPNPRSETRC